MGNCVDRNRRYADLIVNWLASPAKDRQSEPFGQALCGFAFKLDVRTREMRILCKLRTLIMMIVNRAGLSLHFASHAGMMVREAMCIVTKIVTMLSSRCQLKRYIYGDERKKRGRRRNATSWRDKSRKKKGVVGKAICVRDEREVRSG